jgi:putative transposase
VLLLQHPVCAEIIFAVWQGLPKHFQSVSLDEFIVMPNHVHGIIVLAGDPVGARSPRPTPPPRQLSDSEQASPHTAGAGTAPLPMARRRPKLGQVVAYFKYETAKRINAVHRRPGAPVWQRNYYEHIIRNEESLSRIRQYIIENPMRWACDRDNPDRMPDAEEDVFWRQYS